ncbi:MAG TPA: hypothetical protein VM054_00240 [bacterium]|nr:hypothetical protein [bacterium]
MRKTILLLLVALTAAWGYAIEAGGTAAAVALRAVSPDFGPLVAGSGAGYYFWDSNETDDWAPMYDWIDAGGGTDLGTGDEASFTVTTPFFIRFCNRDYSAGSTVYVGCNGALSFRNAGIPAANQDIPSTTAPNALAAVAWDDLRGITGDHLYSYLDTSGDLDVWVLSYDPWHRYLSVGPFRFQIQIYERPVEGINNTVEFHYQTVLASGINLGHSATVGLENWGGTEAAAYSYNTNLEAEFAIRFADTHLVDDQLGAFHLLTPEDGYDFMYEETVHFTWEAPEYSGHGNVTYTFLLGRAPDLSDAEEYDCGTNTWFDYFFGDGYDSQWFWSVRADESDLGLSRMAEEIWSLEGNWDVTEATWGQIKAAF